MNYERMWKNLGARLHERARSMHTTMGYTVDTRLIHSAGAIDDTLRLMEEIRMDEERKEDEEEKDLYVKCEECDGRGRNMGGFPCPECKGKGFVRYEGKPSKEA